MLRVTSAPAGSDRRGDKLEKLGYQFLLRRLVPFCYPADGGTAGGLGELFTC